MDDGLGAILIGLMALIFVVISGVTGCTEGREQIRKEAVAAGVGCYVPKMDGRAEFRWNCKQQ